MVSRTRLSRVGETIVVSGTRLWKVGEAIEVSRTRLWRVGEAVEVSETRLWKVGETIEVSGTRLSKVGEPIGTGRDCRGSTRLLTIVDANGCDGATPLIDYTFQAFVYGTSRPYVCHL